MILRMEKFEWPEKIKSEAIEKVREIGEIFDIGKISIQLKELLTLISEGKEIKESKFTQLSKETLTFLKERAHFLNENELKYVLLFLLKETKPENQEQIVKNIEELINQNKEETERIINKEKFEIRKFCLLQESLDALTSYGSWSSLLEFYSNPENQKIKPELLEKALEGAKKSQKWDSLLEFYSNPENQKIRPELLKEALEKSFEKAKRERFEWNSLLKFYSNPENQKIMPELLKEALERARKESDWHSLLKFYSNPENQKIRPELFEEVLSGIKSYGAWNSLLKFYSNPENQKIRPELLEKTLEEGRKTKWFSALLEFYSNPENQKIKPELLKETLEGARKDKWFDSLIKFYSNPENQKIRPELLKEALEKAREIGDWNSLLRFYSHPENQKIMPELFKEALEGARNEALKRAEIWEWFHEGIWGGAVTESWYDSLLRFYSNPENQPKLKESFRDKIEKSVKTIADQNLHNKVIGIYFDYLKDPENPVSLFLLSKNEDLPTLISAYNLGIKPEIILSWNLSEKEKETMLPLLIGLNKNKIKFPFPFIFYPRKEIKQTRQHNELIIDYFRTLNFIYSLPKEIIDNLIENHFKSIKELVEKYKITQTSTSIPFSFLKEMVINTKELKKETFGKLKKILKIEEKITPKEWEKFIKESKYLAQLITLATHYSQRYKEGLPLLGKMVTSIIKGTYSHLRYDLEDPVTRTQLNPLLKNIEDPQKIEKILGIWQGNYFSFSLQEIKSITKTPEEVVINYEDILNHLKSQIIDHKHYETIFNLMPNLSEEDKNKLSSYFESAISGKTINFGELKKSLANSNLDSKKISCFTGIIQLLRDVSLKSKTKPEQHLSTIERLKKNIQENWPELLQTEIIQIDIFDYLENCLKQSIIPREETARKRIFISYFTDHPKTLLEIGAYPVPTCQDYRSKGNLNRRLLGYMLDAHIKALISREIKIEEEINLQDLQNAQIEVDDNNEKITIIFKDGKKIKTAMSKPVARRIVMLGEKDNQSFLLLEPIYSSYGKTDKEIDYLNEPLKKLLNALKEENIDLLTSTSHQVKTPPSHNPAGYYRDV